MKLSILIETEIVPEITEINYYDPKDASLRLEISYYDQLWALVSYLNFSNVELHIECLRRRSIVYAIHDVINLQNVGSWN